MVEYKEIPVDDYGCVYGIIDLNNKSTDGRTGSVSKIMINITGGIFIRPAMLIQMKQPEMVVMTKPPGTMQAPSG